MPGQREIESYEYREARRLNNPPVGMVTAQTDPERAVGRRYAYDPHIDPALQFDSQGAEVEGILDLGLAAQTLEEAQSALRELKRRREPYLAWAGKAERNSFEVPTVSLHVHERIDPKTIIESVRRRNAAASSQPSLFDLPEENPPVREAIDFYKHAHGWSNRLIAGDSLLVMNSLLEKEAMAGKVQMIYIDPPYGIRYGSNFQPFVNRRSVTEGKDEDLTQEPEMIRAFRDTWELGIHSYLTYLRDRLLLARELLSESGSVFVQISDENLHHVRELLDEVLGAENFVSLIAYSTSGGFTSATLSRAGDYLVWYTKNKRELKYRKLFRPKPSEGDARGKYDQIELADGSRRALTPEEKSGYAPLPMGSRVFRVDTLVSQGYRKNTTVPYTYDGETYHPGSNNNWKATVPEGMDRLASAGRLIASAGGKLGYVRYWDDFPAQSLTNVWVDVGGAVQSRADPKAYVVQTGASVVQRCVLMTTDPGDIVFDPTCGGGTTAYVAEEWGRRWITCDTSRVALALAKQRIMTSVFNYFRLAHPADGVSGGFEYKTIPHKTLRSIANAIPAQPETLYDQPLVDTSKARVTGPFTVEAVPAVRMAAPLAALEGESHGFYGHEDASLARSGETLRQSEWRDELLKTGIRGKNGQVLSFSAIEPLGGYRYLHALAEVGPDDARANHVREVTAASEARRAAICFGPEYAPLEQRQVEEAIQEAQTIVPHPRLLVFAAFQFDPEAAKDIDETNWPGVTLLKAQMNTDLLTEDLRKARSSNQSFWLVGQPDVELRRINQGPDAGKWQVEVYGFDYYNTKSGEVEAGSTSRIAMWLLDPDYDDRSLFPRQVFFPMGDEKHDWTRLTKTLRAEIDAELIERYRGTVSLPFEVGAHRKVAVKIVDDRGIESLKLLRITQ